MTYYNEDQLSRYFEKAIEKESKKRIEKLTKEINYIYQKEMKKIAEELSIKKNLELSKKLRDVQIEYQERLNQIGIGYDEKLIAVRTELSSSIFNQVIKKVKEYTQSKDYLDNISLKIDEVVKTYPKDHLYFSISMHDDSLEKLIEKKFSNQAFTIEKTHHIKLGGFRVIIGKKNIEIDQTIDYKFAEQQQWFYQNSKLFIRQ